MTKPMDRRNVEVLVKSMGISLTVIVVDRFLRGPAPGMIRLVADMGLYLALALLTGVLRPNDVRRAINVVRSRRAESKRA